MDLFVSNKIKHNQEIIGDQLREKREMNNLTLLDASRKVGINVEYLKFIESGKFEKLPVGVYGKNFLREYMNFLNINSEEALEFLEELKEKKDLSQEGLFVQKVTKMHQFLIIPKIAKYFLVFCGVLLCILYLAYYINNIISAPFLYLENLDKDLVVYENNINVSGRTDVRAEVNINNDNVLLNKNGNFSKNVNLKKGLNVITVVSQKKYSKKNIIVRNIIFKERN